LEKKLKHGNSDARDRDYQQRLNELESYWQIILQANEPSVLKKEYRETLERIRTEQLLLADNSNIPLVSEDELHALSVSHGSLTGADRWYKEAVPVEKALDILHGEVAQGKLDPVLFELFVEKKIHELTSPKVLTAA